MRALANNPKILLLDEPTGMISYLKNRVIVISFIQLILIKYLLHSLKKGI